MGKVSPSQHPQGIPGRLCCLSTVPFPPGQLQNPLIGATTRKKTDSIPPPTPKTALELPPPLPLDKRCFTKSYFPKAVNLSRVQRLEAPGRDPEGAVSVPHKPRLRGLGGAAGTSKVTPPSLGAGIIMPTVWEWLQGHETAEGRPGARSNSATAHTTRPLCPAAAVAEDGGGQRGRPEPPRNGIRAWMLQPHPGIEPLKHHPPRSPFGITKRKWSVATQGFGVWGTR